VQQQHKQVAAQLAVLAPSLQVTIVLHNFCSKSIQ
jgi:hypothetical protein